ncbi:3917_t:CDS:2 [Ambispora leptoticha]|uniref:3917_t:CDS:1 n=1 Tax=Ambispora leptoticha TaxID=144679 RepID=A0A9N8WF89_9GLOM|nr:3917_t:CDS:2 [Ambispora leptoticha]
MEQRFSIPYLAGASHQPQDAVVVSASNLSKHRTIMSNNPNTTTTTTINSTQIQNHGELFGGSTIIKPTSQTELTRTSNDFSSSYLSSSTEFSTSQLPTSSFNQFTQSSDILMTPSTSSPSTAIAGECCTECCPVAAAEAATTKQNGADGFVIEDSELQRFSFSSFKYSQIFDYGSSASRLPTFGQPQSTRVPLSNGIETSSDHHLSAIFACYENHEQMSPINHASPIINSNETENISSSIISLNQDNTTSTESLQSAFTFPSSSDVEVIRDDRNGIIINPSPHSFSDDSISDDFSSETPSTFNLTINTNRKENPLFDETSDEMRCLWSTCAAVFSSIDELVPHLSKFHVAGRRKGNLCLWASCSMEKEGRDELIEHVCSDHLNTRQFQHCCKWDGCSLRFETFDELTAHVSESHIGSGRSQYVCQWESCSRNGRPFNQRQKVMRHIQTHTGDKPYQCTVCKKRFSEPNIMTQHMRTHTGERPYKCPIPGCDREFSISGALTIHLRVHTGEKPFKCKHEGCNKRFAESSNLTKHMRVHTGERPFKCPIETCNKKFSRPDQVTRHMKTHNKK